MAIIVDDACRMRSPAGSSRVLITVLFVVYLTLLVWIVLWKLSVPTIGAAALLPHPIKLVPFLASGDADASAPLEVVANILLFVPFGVYLGLVAPRWQWWMSTVVVLGTSLLLETAQHLLSVGTFDVTDLITNTAGGLAGLGVLALARRGLRDRTDAVLTRVLLVATVLALIAAAVFVASPLRYQQPQDVVPQAYSGRPPTR
jgi:glycopeptide antibiotics resistance protein